MNGEGKNLVLAICISLLILLAWDQFYLAPKRDKTIEIDLKRQEMIAQQRAQNGQSNDMPLPGPSVPLQTDQAVPSPLETGERIDILNAELKGSLSLTGARFDDLALLNHQTSLDSGIPVQLLEQATSSDGYYVRFGWQAPGRESDFVPGTNTVWQASGGQLTPNDPLILYWENGQNVRFEQEISIDDRFLFTILQRVINTTPDPINLQPYGFVHRKGVVSTEGIFVLHEGPFAVMDNSLVEESYDDLRDEPVLSTTSTGGWMGITDKYWMTTLIPDQQSPLNLARLRVYDTPEGQATRAEYIEQIRSVAAGQVGENVTHFYAGAKIVEAIDDYADRLDIPLFDRAIDWGWFYFLTRPIFYILHTIFGLIGNFGVAIILLTILVKGALFPVANKGYVSMAHMKKAQPKMKALQERYKEDRSKLSQEMMALYKKEKINPLAGCLPMILQIPVFFALYKVLYVTIEMRHQPFFGWIHDLSAPDPLTPVTLFGLIPWDPPSFIAIGIWPIIMGFSMWLQQKVNPQTNMDPTQAKILQLLPIVFTFVLANFATGLVIYWTLNSLLSIAQQYYIQQRELKKSSHPVKST